MPIRLGINGLGRIGRLALKNAWEDKDFTVRAINSRSGASLYSHLIKNDSTYGTWKHDVKALGNDAIVIDGKKIPLIHESDPKDIPWKKLGVDVVIESSGVFTKRKDSSKHIRAGAKKVFISAPAAESDVTLVQGVNMKTYDAQKHQIISAASCTSNCLAPLVKVLHDNLKIIHGNLVTVHALTNDQSLLDAPHKKEDLRRARAAYESIIPTTTGATQTIGLLMPELKDKLEGLSMRVPVSVPSVLQLSVEVQKETTADAVNKILQAASKNSFRGILSVSEKPLVSIDYKGNPHASIVDSLLTNVVDKTHVTVISWYDNEWGYVNQMNRLIKRIMR